MEGKIQMCLEKQINDAKTEITNSKLELADLFLSIIESKLYNSNICLLEKLPDIEKTINLIERIKSQEEKLNILLKSQAEIIAVCENWL